MRHRPIGCRVWWDKVARRAVSSGTIVLFIRKLYRLLQNITGSIRLFQLGGFVAGKDKRGTLDMRVEVVKNSQLSVNIRVDMRVVTRIKPLKAMQVVDFPDIEENNGATDPDIGCRGAPKGVK